MTLNEVTGETTRTRRRKVLLITLEPVSSKMAGPAIRCLELGRQLSDEFDVCVLSPVASEAEESLRKLFRLPDNMKLATGLSKSAVYNLSAEYDVLFIQANVLKPYPKLSQLGKYLVVDLYDPYLLSLLVQYERDSTTASASYRLMHQVLEKHMLTADFSVCASERQRDYWIGRYCALGRVNPEMYAFDPTLRKLIDLVPFGIPSHEPVVNGKGLRQTVQGIGENDRVLIWGGGIWDWFDPLTVIEAVGRLSAKVPNLRLFFMGWKSPNPKVPVMDMALKAKKRSDELKLTGSHVFFGETWIPYEERTNYLLESDIAVSAHFDLPETRFSFRTRILDYLWAGLPTLTTQGDQLAELIQTNGAGRALPYKDVSAWEDAIAEILRNKDVETNCRKNAKKLAADFTWEKNCQALRDFCRNPYHLPAHRKVTMPSVLERAHAVYSRGGKALVLKRSSELIKDLLRS